MPRAGRYLGMDLTDAQRNALENLDLKSQGKEVAYINISAARALTELGLAHRSAQGWEITAAGSALLRKDESR